jgi:hypothetical protein
MPFSEIKAIVSQFSSLASEALKVYTPIVNEIIEKQSQDENHIQRTLDYLLDFCFDDKMLNLYKRLCRYYWDINPQVTADYINYYREMYDS